MFNFFWILRRKVVLVFFKEVILFGYLGEVLNFKMTFWKKFGLEYANGIGWYKEVYLNVELIGKIDFIESGNFIWKIILYKSLKDFFKLKKLFKFKIDVLVFEGKFGNGRKLWNFLIVLFDICVFFEICFCNVKLIIEEMMGFDEDVD